MDEELKQKFLDFAEYLEDIRQRLYGILAIFIIFFVVGFSVSGRLLSYIIKWFHLNNATIVSTSPFQFLDLAMSVGIFLGLFCCAPLIIYHLYDFLKDGLIKREKFYFLLLLPVSFFLFLFGFLYGFGVLYYCLDIMAAINTSLGIVNMWDIGKFIYEVCLTSVLLGILFEFPIVLFFLMEMGAFEVSLLKKNRKIAVAAIFVIVSLLPPTDGVSLVVMAVPMILIYELTIIAGKVLIRKKTSNSVIVPNLSETNINS